MGEDEGEDKKEESVHSRKTLLAKLSTAKIAAGFKYASRAFSHLSRRTDVSVLAGRTKATIELSIIKILHSSSPSCCSKKSSIFNTSTFTGLIGIFTVRGVPILGHSASNRHSMGLMLSVSSVIPKR